MDRYVKNFIAMSIVYLVVASIIGIYMLISPRTLAGYKFVHSHLMLLGWVSMMIYGVGYHILPRFAGRLLKHSSLAEAQFWMANIGLVGMAVFYVLLTENGSFTYRALLGLFGILEVFSIFIFFYNMFVTIYTKQPEGG